MRTQGYTPTWVHQHTTTRERRKRRYLITLMGIRQFKKMQRKERRV